VVKFTTDGFVDQNWRSYWAEKSGIDVSRQQSSKTAKTITITEFIYKSKEEKVYFAWRAVSPTASGTTLFVQEMVFDGEKLTTIQRNGDTVSALISGRAMPAIMKAFRSAFGLDYRGKPWSEALQEVGPRLVAKEVVNGDDCYVLEIDGQTQNMTRVWIDPSKGFLVRRRIEYWPNGEVKEWQNVEELKEYADGVWMPSKVTRRSYSSTDRYGTHIVHAENVATAHELRVNTGLSDDDFTLHLAKGTIVYNEGLDEWYTIDDEPTPDDDNRQNQVGEPPPEPMAFP